jgi:hypothetical protein
MLQIKHRNNNTFIKEIDLFNFVAYWYYAVALYGLYHHIFVIEVTNMSYNKFYSMDLTNLDYLGLCFSKPLIFVCIMQIFALPCHCI